LSPNNIVPSQLQDATNKNVQIGGLSIVPLPSAAVQYYSGVVDNLRIYNLALNGSDVTGDMQTPIRPRLVAAYSFDAVVNQSVQDASTFAGTGAVTGAALVNAGRFGQALSFSNRTETFVDLGAPAQLQMFGSQTLMAWIKPTGVYGPDDSDIISNDDVVQVIDRSSSRIDALR
jgi:hypothetical protein